MQRLGVFGAVGETGAVRRVGEDAACAVCDVVSMSGEEYWSEEFYQDKAKSSLLNSFIQGDCIPCVSIVDDNGITHW